ncbi:hypothetical protein IA64_16155 [Xanthomonas arboricola pv. celebensis]|nr:hypothetical protein IA64_16155 [Xanthomonas arboricola pv. celebensis]
MVRTLQKEPTQQRLPALRYRQNLVEYSATMSAHGVRATQARLLRYLRKMAFCCRAIVLQPGVGQLLKRPMKVAAEVRYVCAHSGFLLKVMSPTSSVRTATERRPAT